jgi:predicted ATP-grasp superfamily ATP-dependent carboligase
MMEGRMNILLLGAGTQGLAIVKGLAKAGFDISMLIDEDGNYGDKSRYVSKKFFCHSNVGTPEHLNEIKSLLKREKFDVVIPMGDADADFLSKNQEVLSKCVSFVIPSYESFMKGYDKNKLMALCAQKGYPHPQTIDISKVNVSGNDTLRQFPYPAILKPNCTTGGRGMRVVESYEEMLSYALRPETWATTRLELEGRGVSRCCAEPWCPGVSPPELLERGGGAPWSSALIPRL